MFLGAHLQTACSEALHVLPEAGLSPPAPWQRSRQEVPGFVGAREGSFSLPALLGCRGNGHTVKSALEEVGKLRTPPKMGFPRHQDGGGAALRTPGGAVCTPYPQSGLHVPIVWLPSAARKPSLAPRRLHPKVLVPKDVHDYRVPPTPSHSKGHPLFHDCANCPHHRCLCHVLSGCCLVYPTLSAFLHQCQRPPPPQSLPSPFSCHHPATSESWGPLGSLLGDAGPS